MRAKEVGILEASNKTLMEISRKGLLSLTLEEMKQVQEYCKEKGRNPTDVELETLAQTWSEHCVHKTFNALIKTPEGEIDSLFKTYIFKATNELDKPWCLSVFEDNAGIIEFDEEYAVAMKVETHNHPTALDPYGGAGTGTGGVFRDVMGVGAKPILSTDVLFFGPIDYPHEKLPSGTMHPKRLMKGSVAGIRDYGNRMGIPTSNGGVAFDEGYIGNPLIYAGTVGIMPKNKYVNEQKPEDLILLVGGKTGRDGIHGVTFASVELEEESEKTSSGAVQIGNPIEEKKVLDGLLRARDAEEKPLYSAITDCGGGGLSSAIGEMGKKLGVEVHLEKVPLKYAGLEPWEIWISEAQERMILAVPKKNKEKILEIFKNENCEATFIGKFRNDKKLILYHEKELICELDMDFLHRVPRLTRQAKQKKPVFSEPKLLDKVNFGDELKKILKSPNVASKEWVIRQYDHEVQAKTVIKPLQGKNYGPGDACVLKPLYDSWKGVVISNGVNSKYCSDPYNMTLSAIDEAMRNNVCCGGRRIAILDNFSWGSPENPETMGALVEACKGCYDGVKGFDVPLISGKDSLHNEYVVKGRSIAIPHTLVISAIGVIPDVRKAVTMDLKKPGSSIYIIGNTLDELGGSHYLLVNNLSGGKVPTVNMEKAKKAMDSLITAIDLDLVLSCHDCSEGGLAVAAAEMAFAGGLGMMIDLELVPSKLNRDDKILFSESNSRFLIEVEKSKEKKFEETMEGSVFAKIGETTEEPKLKISERRQLDPSREDDIKKLVIDEPVKELKMAWDVTFKW